MSTVLRMHQVPMVSSVLLHYLPEEAFRWIWS